MGVFSGFFDNFGKKVEKVIHIIFRDFKKRLGPEKGRNFMKKGSKKQWIIREKSKKYLKRPGLSAKNFETCSIFKSHFEMKMDFRAGGDIIEIS